MSFLKKVQKFLEWVIGGLISVLSLMINGDRPRARIPAIRDSLLLESGVSLARKIRSREVTSTVVVEAYIARIKEVNGLLNAMVVERFNDALAEARQVDEMLDSGNVPDRFSEKNAPFLGVPVSIKEAFSVKGMANTSGLVSRKDVKAPNDAPPVANMKKAGCIVLGLTNCSELCMWYESSNYVYGKTSNPYDIRRMVGGSSGGEGCIIGAGASVMGIGADIGGSIRMPAFFNGVFGHKPSNDVVSNVGQFPTCEGKGNELMVTGPICRFAADLAPLLKVMAGPHGMAKLQLDTHVDLRRVRYFSMGTDDRKLLVSKLDPELRDAQLRAARYLEEELDVQVTHTSNRRFYHSISFWFEMMQAADEESFVSLMGDHGSAVNCYVEAAKRCVGRSQHTVPAIALGLLESLDRVIPRKSEKVLRACQKLRNEIMTMLGDDGVLLYPTHPKMALFHNAPLLYPFNVAYTGIFNALGLPVTQVPLGLSSNGLPLGVQVVGNKYCDHLTLAVARELERGFGGWTAPIAASSLHGKSLGKDQGM
ncbi:fatty-acid amide hydrolase 2-like [Diadema antillarum]|uniref:fatty-acid amide hydrolase 2-like n=1 Tax=Diadema antillarum TaxID=105358 RepID=UPI003A8B85BF